MPHLAPFLVLLLPAALGPAAPLRAPAAGQAPAPTPAPTPVQDPPPVEPVHTASLLDNGGFEEPLPRVRGPFGFSPIPWWGSSHGARQVVAGPRGARARTGPGEWLSQPVAAYAPLARGLVLRGRVAGLGRLVVRDGAGRAATFEVGAAGAEEEAFVVTGEDVARELGGEPQPRFVVELRPGPAGEVALWDELVAEVPLPGPTVEALEAEIVAELEFFFGLWFERALDDVGPRETTFACHYHDVVTGERLSTFQAGFHPLYELLFEALKHVEHEAWQRALEAHLEDYLELAVHPVSHLPCAYDPVEDVRAERDSLQISRQLGFLIDVAEAGPPAFRERARDAAKRAGETILAVGVLPDGVVAPIYQPASGRPFGDSPTLRRLDVPAQLARLAALTGDVRFRDAAREALLEFEYTHAWAGDWLAIDPGFDDNYGHFGKRALTMWKAVPEEEAFSHMVLSGWDYYAGRWRDALRLGGNIAADQVRCWEIAIDMAHLRVDRQAEVAALVDSAVRSHFKGQQYGNGAWGDVTIFGFDPKTNLQVGDLPGVPQNLMQGLALACDPELGNDAALYRAMFTAVLRSSREVYRRPYGYLRLRGEQVGHNPSGGSIRCAAGLVEMLKRL